MKKQEPCCTRVHNNVKSCDTDDGVRVRVCTYRVSLISETRTLRFSEYVGFKTNSYRTCWVWRPIYQASTSKISNVFSNFTSTCTSSNSTSVIPSCPLHQKIKRGACFRGIDISRKIIRSGLSRNDSPTCQEVNGTRKQSQLQEQGHVQYQTSRVERVITRFETHTVRAVVVVESMVFTVSHTTKMKPVVPDQAQCRTRRNTI